MASQAGSAPASEQDSSGKQSDTSGRAAQDGSATEIQAAQGEAEAADSNATADGESDPSSATKKSSKSATGEDTAHQSSGAGSAEREGGRGGGSRGSGKVKSSGQTTGKPSSPGEAVAEAKTFKERSDKAAAGKEYGQAFELATKAWESVQAFPKDAACREMSNNLQRRIEELATLANAQRGSDLKRDKPLIVR